MSQRTSPAAFAERRKRLQHRLEERGVATAALASGWARPRNFAHNPYPFRAESHFLYLVGAVLEGAVLVYRSGEFVLYVTEPAAEMALWAGPSPSMRDLEAAHGLPVRSIDDLDAPGAATLPPQDDETALWMSHLLERDVEAGSGAEVENGDLDLAEAMISLRLRHDDAALAQIRAALSITARAHRAGMNATRRATSEAVVRAAMESQMIAAGMVPAYGSIVTTHGEILHDTARNRPLSAGQLLLCDVGAESPEGWASDITRTWPVSGSFSPSQRDLYQAVLDAQKAAIDTVAPGVRYRNVHRAASLTLASRLVDLGILRGTPESLYERGAVGLFFPHGIGHLLGLDVHDMEDLGDRAGYDQGRVRSAHPGENALRLDRDLEPGMVVTIEPGFYRIPYLMGDAARLEPLRDAIAFDVLERFSDVRGIRIEDDVLVTETGAEVLSESIPKMPHEVEGLVQASADELLH